MERISASVGRKGINQPKDVKAIQKLLNIQKIPGVIVPLKVDGKIGPNSITRIESFQKKVMKIARPDGKIDPDGKTLKKLIEGTMKIEAKLPNIMVLGTKATELLQSIEQLSIKPYDDQTGSDITQWVKGATIGYGHLISQTEWPKYKDGITSKQASELFAADLKPYVSVVNRKVTGMIRQNEFDAMVILAFNIGTDAFSGSSVLKLVNDPGAKTSYNNLESAWKAWNKSQGIVNKGLINRRKAEWNIYSNGSYKKW